MPDSKNLKVKSSMAGQGSSDASRSGAGEDPNFAEWIELDRQGKLDEAAMARIAARARPDIARIDQERDRTMAEIAALSAKRPLGFSKPYGVLVVVGIFFLLVGAVLEPALGAGFIFSHSNAYRAAMPWVFFIVTPPMAVLMFFVEKRGKVISTDKYHGEWDRWLIVFPIMVACVAGMVVLAPLVGPRYWAG